MPRRVGAHRPAGAELELVAAYGKEALALRDGKLAIVVGAGKIKLVKTA